MPNKFFNSMQEKPKAGRRDAALGSATSGNGPDKTSFTGELPGKQSNIGWGGGTSQVKHYIDRKF